MWLVQILPRQVRSQTALLPDERTINYHRLPALARGNLPRAEDGAGLGMVYGELDDNGVNSDDTVFGYQVIVGAAYNFNKNFALDLSYRFQGAAEDFSQNNMDLSYMSSSIMAGLRYSF